MAWDLDSLSTAFSHYVPSCMLHSKSEALFQVALLNEIWQTATKTLPILAVKPTLWNAFLKEVCQAFILYYFRQLAKTRLFQKAFRRLASLDFVALASLPQMIDDVFVCGV